MSGFPARPGRAELEVPVAIVADQIQTSGVTGNISVGGLFVATRKIHPVGARVTVAFVLPGDEQRIEVEAEVRWSRRFSVDDRDDRSPGMGLRFVDPPIDAAFSVRAYLRSRVPAVN